MSESVLDDEILPVGSAFTFDDGLEVRIDEVQPYELVDPDDAHGHRRGDDLVSCTLYLANGTGRRFDLDPVRVRVRCGVNGRAGRQVEDPGSDLLDDFLEGSLRPGRRVSATWAFSIPRGTLGELDFEVTLAYDEDERDSVTFTTAQTGAVPAQRSRGNDGEAARAPGHGVPQIADQAVLFGQEQHSLFDEQDEPLAAEGEIDLFTDETDDADGADDADAGGDGAYAPDVQPAPPAQPQDTKLSPDQTDALRVRQIFQFLAAAEAARTRPVRTLDAAQGVVWFDELPDHSGVAAIVEEQPGAGEPAWLTVRRPQREEPPQPHATLAPWVDERRIRDFTQQRPPHLRRRIEPQMPDWSRGIPLEKTYHELDDHPDRERIEKLYTQWEQAWTSWAGRRRAVEPLVKLYDKLHKMHEDTVNLGEAYELVLGFGRLTWRTSDGQRVERHLVTHRATLRLDPATGTLTAAPDAETQGLTLEESMLDGEQQAQGAVREQVRAALDDAGDATETERLDHLHTALRSWANAAHSAGSYQPGLDRLTPSTLDHPQVGFTPALVLRERTRRSTLEALEAIARHVERGTAPTGLLRYIAGRDAELTAADLAAVTGTGERADEVYFALPANEEQRSIAERLRDNRLVVVQGPPGTGKTHTIANLVTDLLAQGKRVLITSHTARALRVLREKLPPTVRDLCVSRTQDGASARRELESSVNVILSRYAGYDPKASRREIGTLQRRLDKARAARDEMLAQLAVLREQETRKFPADIGDYSGTLQQIAERLAAERPAHEWLGPVPQEQPTLGAEESLRLLHTTRDYTPDKQALASEVPGPAELPTPAAFDEAVATVLGAEEAHAAVRREPYGERYDGHIQVLTEQQQEVLRAALDAFAAACAHAVPLTRQTGMWAHDGLEEVQRGQEWQVRSRHVAVTEAVTAVESCLADLGTALVTGLDGYAPQEALCLATSLHDGLVQGQKLRGLLGKTKLGKTAGEFAARVRVDGRAPEEAVTAAVVLARVQLELRLAQVESEWGTPAEPWAGHGPRLARLHQDARTLDALLEVGAARGSVVVAAAAAPQLADADWHEPATESAVRALLRARATLRDAEQARRLLSAAEELLRTWTDRPGDPEVVVKARDAVTARDVEAYRDCCEELADVRAATALRAAHHSALTVVREAFPSLAEQITRSADDPTWDGRLARLHEAWAWSAWRARLERATDPDAERILRGRLAEADDDIRITLSKLAAARAWDGSLSLLTVEQSRALKNYQHSMRHTRGKYQHRYRRDAQAALRKAQSAVPAWIMPLHQVAESVPMDRPGLFDVVIVDEASQSGLEAMLLSWLADRMVVVGDDKQVSPSHVGLDREEQFQLRDRRLTSLPTEVRGLFDPESSLFDLSAGLSAGRGTLMLKEHFRCMPEIIAFSNELWYDDLLQPLRQYGADRLPPVRTVLVEGGEAAGSGSRMVNHAEASELVDTLVACCADPAYADRTMGVISLRSSKAHLTELENLLTDRLSYEEREERKIRVGDAEDFQGDERDVMFVSCVNSATTASGTVAGGFNGKTYEQRLNVAASRACDQLWIFHSARPEQFHENDLRRRWLDTLARPAEQPEAGTAREVLPDQRHEEFESLFQQRVYLEITARGYRVRPQYQVGRHALDLVVEGGTRRVAVECDGDSFAEGEDAATGAARQRDLERVNWTFVRIRSSRFHWDREEAMAPLWAELERLGVAPAPDPDSVGAVVEGEADPRPVGDGADETGPVGEGEPEPEAEATASDGEPAAAPAPASAPAPEPPGHGTTAEDGSRPPIPRERAESERTDAVPRAAGRFPVRNIPAACFQRVLGELNELQAALDAPDVRPEGTDPANFVFLQRNQRHERDRRTQRVTYLRAFLDAVSVTDARSPDTVIPGTLMRLAFDGEADEDTLYTVAELHTGDTAETISPSSPLGLALMWQRTGSQVVYRTGDGKERRATVRELRG
ncbi:AAA domain-containing protein [Streptomyces sp. TR06-5]|uniref:AAA domain-containing protein n=1 Tax=Streptomyces sp. TR06-5 TaxID=3385976 RepID=UPI00399FFE3F